MGKKYRGRVRQSCLRFASKFVEDAPRAVTELHIKTIAPMIFDMVLEDNPLIQATFWKEAVYNLSAAFPQVWSLINLKKSFNQNLLNCVKNGGYGASIAMY